MIAHTSLAISDYPKAKAFYSKVLATLGYRNNMEYGEAAGFNDGKNTDFWISKKQSVIPTHLAFEANSREQVEAFHRAALAAGGKNQRTRLSRLFLGYYAAFALDPDGNNIEAVWYDPSKEK